MRKACAIPGVVPLTLRRWEKIGEIQCIRTPSGQRHYARREILRLLGENLPGGTRAVLYARESSAKQAGMESYGLAVHQAAALVIARRALDYKEKVPRNVRKVVAATEAGSHLKGWGKLFGMLKHTRQSAIRERAYKKDWVLDDYPAYARHRRKEKQDAA
ncbi:MAG: MerR family DNA-binding transcriptional regulator [Peptococcaceae bacterium]|nr:MerR family DNA-binding transcriptional regulator [Peptococcaceae bacterium]